MPRNITVTLDDGTQHSYQNVPDDVTPEQVTQRAQQEFDKGVTSIDGGRSSENQPDEQEQKKESIGVFDALKAGAKRGVEQVALGVTQRVMEFNKGRHEKAIDEFASKMQSGEIPATAENIAKLDEMQQQVINEQKALGLGQGFEQSQRENMAPISEAQPVASFIGNVAGQMAAAPLPAAKGLNLWGQSAKAGAEGVGLGFVQPTVEGESVDANAMIGGGVGLLAPSVLRGVSTATGAGYRAVTGNPTQEMAEQIKYAQSNNLPLMTTDLLQPQTGMGKKIRSIAEDVPLTGTGAARADQQAARVAQMEKLSNDFGVPNDREIIESINRKGNKITAAAGERYKNVISQMGDEPIPLTNTNKAIDQAIAAHTRGGRLENKALVDQLQSIKAKLNESGQDIELLRLNRTDVRERLKTDETIGRDTAARVIDKLYAGMTQDMTNGVAAKLGNESAAKMRQADAIWARETNEIQKTKLKNILSKGEILPDKVNAMLFSRSPAEAEILYQSLDKAGRNNARAAIFGKAFEIAQGSPDKFLAEINKLRFKDGTGKSTIDVFFKGDNKKQLDGLIKYLDSTREASAAALNPATGQRLGALIPTTFGGIGLTAGGPTGAAIGVGSYLGVGALASVYESPPVRNLMVKMAGTPKGSTQFEKYARQLEEELVKASSKITQVGKQE